MYYVKRKYPYHYLAKDLASWVETRADLRCYTTTSLTEAVEQRRLQAQASSAVSVVEVIPEREVEIVPPTVVKARTPIISVEEMRRVLDGCSDDALVTIFNVCRYRGPQCGDSSKRFVD